MGGFVGFLTDRSSTLEGSEVLLTRMADTIEHRGPDDAGAWIDVQSGVTLGFRRLSVINLSTAGHKPMTSSGGRFIIVFNSEIYNHLEIRAELMTMGAAPVWRSDNSRNVVETNSLLADHPLPEGDLTDVTNSPLEMM